MRWYLGEPDKGRAEYDSAHIPGAAYVHLENDLCAPSGPGRHPLPEWRDFSATLGRLGISPNHTVVAYDDRGGAIAARLWWMLRALDHPWVMVLDGGLTAWLAEERPVTAAPTVYPPTRYPYREPMLPTIDQHQLANRLGEVTVIDARAPERYRGEEEPIDPVAGHIPTAVNLPYADNLALLDRFRDRGELATAYQAAGIGDNEVVVYCGSGVTACHDILAMEVAGLGPATLYPGSWSDWLEKGEVATGDY